MNILSRSEEIVLLAIWKLKDNAYGVTIRELVSKDTGREWTFGAVYKPLKQLVHKGFVDKSASSPSAERGGRAPFPLCDRPDEGEEPGGGHHPHDPAQVECHTPQVGSGRPQQHQTIQETTSAIRRARSANATTTATSAATVAEAP